MADWTSTTTTVLGPEWMRSTTQQRLAVCRTVHAPVHPGDRVVPPPMSDFLYLEGAPDRAPWWWLFKPRAQADKPVLCPECGTRRIRLVSRPTETFKRWVCDCGATGRW